MAKIPAEITLRPVEWLGDRLRILDQTQLPGREIYLELTDYRDIIAAIKQLKVRGAPAIGITAAYGIVVGAVSIKESDEKKYRLRLDTVMA
jgi:methylthioribose-1-phosphate isomerase